MYLIVILSQLQHFLHDGLIELAVLAVVLQGQPLHPALLMQVQQHLKNNSSHVIYALCKIIYIHVQKIYKWSVFSNLLLQLVFPVIDGDGVVVSVESMNQSLTTGQTHTVNHMK